MSTQIITIATAFILFFSIPSFGQNTFFVSAKGTGNGLSWANATSNLSEVLEKAKAGDQVWIAAGTYLPKQKNNRKATFNIPSGVSIYGGFAGTESALQQRDPQKNTTILSGNIGSEDATDNCYNVVTIGKSDANTLLDGLTITQGFADGEGVTGFPSRSGGGVFLDGTKGASNPTFQNCRFTQNFAKDGGAIYCNGRKGEASPTFVGCHFDANSSDLDGGALYCDGRLMGKSNVTLTSCTFEENKGNYGGAVACYGMEGEANPSYESCVFTENMAYLKGGALFYLNHSAIDKALFNSVQFNNNTSLDHTSDEVYQYLVNTKQVAVR